MYLSLSDRPETTADPDPDRAAGGRLRGRVRGQVPRIVLALGLVSLLTDISSESTSAILPLYLTAVVGLTPVAYGFVDGLYQGVSALARIVAGLAADRTDRPQPVALSGYALSAVARVLLIVAGGFTTISAAISLDRIGKGVRTAPRDAMISASSDPARVGRSFGVHRALDTTGAALGPLLAFVILWQIPGGYDTVLVVSLAFAVLGVATMACFVPLRAAARVVSRDVVATDVVSTDVVSTDVVSTDVVSTDVVSTGSTTGGLNAVAPSLSRPRIRWREALDPSLLRLTTVAGVLGLLTVGDGFIYLTLMQGGDFAAQWFPLLFIGTNLAYLSLAVPLGRLADRVGRVRVLVLGHLPLAAAYLCAAVGGGAVVATVAALLLLGVFYAATDGVLAAVAGRLAPPDVRTSGIATAQTAVALARLVASTGFGLLWYALGPAHAMLVVCAALVLVIPAGLAALRRIGTAR